MFVDLLVEVADRTRADSRSPQGLSDILNTTDGDAGQIHLHERFLNRSLTTFITLDDGGLEGLLAQLGHLEVHFTCFGVELPVVMTSTGINAIRRSFVSLDATHGVGLGIQHGVHGLLDGASYQLTEVILNLRLIDVNDFTQCLDLAIVVHGGCFSCGLIKLRNSIVPTWETPPLTQMCEK